MTSHPQPHDSWAHLYDHVHRESFGDGFDNLTAATLALIERTHPAACRVLDIGAGNGRLAVPLAQRGHEVLAIEPSPRLADELRERAIAHELTMPVQVATAQSFVPSEGVGLALAVFTVMNYLLAEVDMRALAERVAASLAPGGSFLFDLADRELFDDCDYETDELRRKVWMTPVGPGLFDYFEECEGVWGGEPFAYTDALQLRCWRPEEVLPIMAAAGLELVEDHSEELLGTASRYLRVRLA